MKLNALLFTAPGEVCIETETLPDPQPGQVLVKTEVSAISSGTEMLVFRGQWPRGLAVDETIPALAGEFGYPMKYGYAAVGSVVDTSSQGQAQEWLGKRVFSFHPHESLFWTKPEELMPLPGDISLEDGVFLPNVETAVNFVMDGAPLSGEKVVVFGQGVVGLLTTSLLGQFPLAALVTVDQYPLRRKLSLDSGAHASLEPFPIERIKSYLRDGTPSAPLAGADLAFELSGNPQALDAAIECTRFSGRVVVGSWYGQKTAPLDLGGWFHRSRIRLISSQVSSLSPELSARWSKQRRFAWTWEMIRRVQPSRLVTHKIPFDQASQAYQILADAPDQAVQILLDYRIG